MLNVLCCGRLEDGPSDELARKRFHPMQVVFSVKKTYTQVKSESDPELHWKNNFSLIAFVFIILKREHLKSEPYLPMCGKHFDPSKLQVFTTPSPHL